jgi:hypothetical protein
MSRRQIKEEFEFGVGSSTHLQVFLEDLPGKIEIFRYESCEGSIKVEVSIDGPDWAVNNVFFKKSPVILVISYKNQDRRSRPGDRSVNVGGSINGSIIITGDKNVVGGHGGSGLGGVYFETRIRVPYGTEVVVISGETKTHYY